MTLNKQRCHFSIDIQNQKTTALVFQKNMYETSTIKISYDIGKKVKVILLNIKVIKELVFIPYAGAAY